MLPEGCYYVLKPQTSVPAMVASPKRPAPKKPWPAKTQDYLDSIVMELIKQPHEHFVAVGLSESGYVTFTEQQSQAQWDHCSVDMKPILTQLGPQTTGLICYHNHPDGSVEMSHQDRDLTERLTTALKAYEVTLIKHQVVPADVDLQEAATVSQASGLDYLTDWHQRQADHEYRLAHEPAWLQEIRESTRRRYAR